MNVVEAQIVFCEKCRARLLLSPKRWEAIFERSGYGEDHGQGTMFRVAEVDGGWRLYYDRQSVRMRACCPAHAEQLPFPDEGVTYQPLGPERSN